MGINVLKIGIRGNTHRRKTKFPTIKTTIYLPNNCEYNYPLINFIAETSVSGDQCHQPHLLLEESK